MAGRKKEQSIVADDQNWRSYIHNELKCAEIWHQDWGFLAAKGGTYEKPLTLDEQIRKKEEELQNMDARKWTTTQQNYGYGNNMELFPEKVHNITKNPDLMACPRKPPKKGA